MLAPHLLPFLELLARAGGGGSSSGGGGIGSAIILVGYIPSYLIGLLIKKLLPRRAELILSATLSGVASLCLLIVAVVSGLSLFIISLLIITGIWLGWSSAFFGVWDRIKARATRAKTTVDSAAQLDSAWNLEALKKTATDTFFAYQQDWSSFNLQRIATYTSHRFARHTGLMLRILYELGRTNTMENVRIKQLEVINAHDDTNNAQDTFTVAIEAQATDSLWRNSQPSTDPTNTPARTPLFTTSNSFTEYWTFVRSNDTWLLDRIEQATASPLSTYETMRQFAAATNMYYSPDMGWLFLPNKGVLFSGGKFGLSDINNHVVGLYNDHLVQLYTYQAYGSTTSSRNAEYLVAQITLPKSYEGILIRRKAGIFNSLQPPRAPSTYKEYRLEWPDFHQRYTVHATNQDRLAAFELLNPGFMAYLYDTDPGVSIEVADSTVYIYKIVATSGPSHKTQYYNTLLTILTKAFKELQL